VADGSKEIGILCGVLCLEYCRYERRRDGEGTQVLGTGRRYDHTSLSRGGKRAGERVVVAVMVMASVERGEGILIE